MAVYQVSDWLKHATGLLESSQVPSASLDALILLEDITKKDRAYLLAHPEYTLSNSDISALEAQIIRRSAHEPLAYIRGRSEFYGREFFVTPATLQPRPETETIITLLKGLNLRPATNIADVGTGSGAIAVTAKLELPLSTVYATDIQDDAIKVAQKNASILKAEIIIKKGNLLQPLTDTYIDVVLANLPYVPTGHTINQAAMQEPAIAIFGGKDGLDIYRQLFDQLKARPQKPQYVLTESLPFQHKDLKNIALNNKYKLDSSADFIQVFNLND